jgi:ketosteroid isomerase-like protein
MEQRIMDMKASDTESIVRNHLQVFLEQKGVDAIVRDYDDDARVFSEVKTYHGKSEIRQFFEAFIASLPPDTIERFSLRTLRVEGEIAYLTWSAGNAIPLGTGTFIVRGGKIVTETFAMHPTAAA